MEFIAELIEKIPAWILAITVLVTGASGMVALTPTKTDDKIYAKVIQVLNVLALNFKDVKPKTDKEAVKK